MAGRSNIEWCTDTWNPIVGCSIVSPGCTNCYAMSMAARIQRMTPGSHYAGTTQPSKAGAVWTGKMVLAPEHILTAPLRWKSPRRIFVNSMGDLFHESVPDDWIDQVFAVMALAPQHVFQVLTKRSTRMRSYCNDRGTPGRIARACVDLWIQKVVDAPALDCQGRWPVEAIGDPEDPDDLTLRTWPLRNAWKGVSTEDQRRADERVPELLETPAAVRFVSAEPLLGPINFNRIHESGETWNGGGWASWESALNGKRFSAWGGPDGNGGDVEGFPRLDWIIVGGESGPNARPMHPQWARDIRDQCAAAGVAFHFKQWGEWITADGVGPDHPELIRFQYRVMDRRPDLVTHEEGFGYARVGKARAGRLLDGVEHNAMPRSA